MFVGTAVCTRGCKCLLRLEELNPFGTGVAGDYEPYFEVDGKQI